VENETNKGGWQRGFRGDHCVTLHGRTYHYLPGSRSHNPSGGLSYFVFDVRFVCLFVCLFQVVKTIIYIYLYDLFIVMAPVTDCDEVMYSVYIFVYFVNIISTIFYSDSDFQHDQLEAC